MKPIISLFLVFFLVGTTPAYVRIKDIASVEGIRDNEIIGYGLVVGLNGSGDKDQSKIAQITLSDYLKRLGLTDVPPDLKVKNVAAVAVTAKLPPFARNGQPIDVTLSSLGDAKSLEGGTLLATPLTGPDGQVYAVAQGPISVGGMNVSSGGSSSTKNHPTVGRIPGGGKVEREIPFEMDTSKFDLFFDTFSLSDVVSAKSVINNYMGREIAVITSPSNIEVSVPAELRGSYYDLLNSILNLRIQPDNVAKIVVQERTGTVVVGSDVRISTVAVAYGNLSVTITSSKDVSQPLPFSGGETAVVEQSKIDVAEDKAKLIVVPEGVTVSDLVKALNAIGASPRDLIGIFQNMQSAGALHARLEII